MHPSKQGSFVSKVLTVTAIVTAVVLLLLFLGAIFRVILIVIAAILVAAFFRVWAAGWRIGLLYPRDSRYSLRW